jgi:hypothetical protein
MKKFLIPLFFVLIAYCSANAQVLSVSGTYNPINEGTGTWTYSVNNTQSASLNFVSSKTGDYPAWYVGIYKNNNLVYWTVFDNSSGLNYSMSNIVYGDVIKVIVRYEIIVGPPATSTSTSTGTVKAYRTDL